MSLSFLHGLLLTELKWTHTQADHILADFSRLQNKKREIFKKNSNSSLSSIFRESDRYYFAYLKRNIINSATFTTIDIIFHRFHDPFSLKCLVL